MTVDPVYLCEEINFVNPALINPELIGARVVA